MTDDLRATFVEHVHCNRCGKRCSGVDPELGLVVRAWVECPECLEQSEHPLRTLEALEQRVIALTLLTTTLIAKWRAEGARVDTFHATMGTGYKACAEELESQVAALDATKAP
jgi:hypothetical protein